MQNMNQGAALPTGSWLSQERLRLGKTQAEVARAVQVHGSTLRSLEMHNRVLPPGWYPQLRALGIRISEPVWPAQMSSYTGADLYRDLGTCSRLRSERGWLSSQLSVSESAVTEVLRRNLPVPPSWLMKLAELGANVPAQVRMTLRPPGGANAHPGAAVVQGWGPGVLLSPPGEVIAAGNEAARSQVEPRVPGDPDAAGPSIMGSGSAQGARSSFDLSRSHGALPSDRLLGLGGPPAASVSSPPVAAGQHDPVARACAPQKKAQAAVPPATSQELARPPLLFFCWNEDGDFHFSVSAPLMKQNPDVFMELLLQLHQCCLSEPVRESGTPASGT